jgi:hypothetical protein
MSTVTTAVTTTATTTTESNPNRKPVESEQGILILLAVLVAISVIGVLLVGG